MTKEEKEQELRDLYSMYRNIHFENKIPPVEEITIELSDRLTSAAGYCTPSKKLIKISSHYLERFPEDDLAILLHEMIHLVVHGHGPRFMAWIHKINRAEGSEVVRRYSLGRAKEGKWLYLCDSCAMEYSYKNRLRLGGKNHRCKCGGELIEVSLHD